jgi:hypothetical protein
LLNVKQYENISKLRLTSLDYEDGPAPYIESFAVGERMQYLDINVRVNKFTNIPPGRFLPRMKLSSYGSKDLSFCANVCQLHLWNCELLESVYAVKDVPYLSIYACNNIYDLACLGAQRYLSILFSEAVNDEDVESFGKISYLELIRCQNVTELLDLKYNRYIQLSDCENLT